LYPRGIAEAKGVTQKRSSAIGGRSAEEARSRVKEPRTTPFELILHYNAGMAQPKRSLKPFFWASVSRVGNLTSKRTCRSPVSEGVSCFGIPSPGSVYSKPW